MPIFLLLGGGVASFFASYFGEKSALMDWSNKKNWLLYAALLLAVIAIAFNFFWAK